MARRLTIEAGVLCSRITHFVALAQAPGDSLVTDMHVFELLRAVNTCNSRLRQLHQTLMTLYPDVTAELVEAVRLARLDTDGLSDFWSVSPHAWNGALSETAETLRQVGAALSKQGG